MRQLRGDGGTRILKSILSCSPVDVAALVVDNGIGMCLLVCWYVTLRAAFPSIVGRLGVWRSVHSRFFSCGICPEPFKSDSQLFAGRELPEKIFFEPLMAHSCELSRTRG